MNIHNTNIKGLVLLDMPPVIDPRGSFVRLFSQDILENIGISRSIVQINLSTTTQKGTLRGMHFQYPPHAECKVVRCLKGSVFDVAVDLRQHSATFLQWHGEILTENNHRSLVIPEGFAHGFLTLEPHVEMLYFHTEFYHPASEGGLRYNDPRVGIDWPFFPSQVSERDKHHPFLGENFAGLLC